MCNFNPVSNKPKSADREILFPYFCSLSLVLLFRKKQIYDNEWVALGLPAFFLMISRLVVKENSINFF